MVCLISLPDQKTEALLSRQLWDSLVEIEIGFG